MAESHCTKTKDTNVPTLDGVRPIAALSVLLAYCSSGNESYGWIATRIGLGSFRCRFVFHAQRSAYNEDSSRCSRFIKSLPCHIRILCAAELANFALVLCCDWYSLSFFPRNLP